MKKQNLSFNSMLLRYQKFCKKLIRLHNSGRNTHRQTVLKRHIERLFAKLSSLQFQLSKSVKFAAGFAALMALPVNNATAQIEFAEKHINTFGLIPATTSASFYGKISHGDLDNDGDLDLLVSEYNGDFHYYQNTGTSVAPEYANPITNPFSLTNAGGYSSSTFADLDNDGDLDLLVSSYVSGSFPFKYFENTGSATVPVFASPTTNPFLLTSMYANDIQLVDMDADNDLDLMVMGNSVSFIENIGTSSAPEFTAAVNSAFSISTIFYRGRFEDMDNDGDNDFIGASNYFTYIENTGTPAAASFGLEVMHPFGLKTLFPNFNNFDVLDIDGDNDVDVIYVHEDQNNFHFFENTGTNTASEFTDGHSNLFSIDFAGGDAHPTFGDLDGDGDLDMLSEDSGSFNYFENIGDATNPNFGQKQVSPFGLGVYIGNTPALVDIDGDNDLDIMMTYSQDFVFIENTGTSTAPVFAAPVTTPFGIATTWSGIEPAYADIDNDGDIDILAKISIYGDMYYFQNTGTATSPSFVTPTVNQIMAADFSVSNPSFGDLDQDGDLDLLFGNTSKGFTYYENTGSAAIPSFVSSQVNPFFLRTVAYDGSNPVGVDPVFVDLNNDGDLDVMAGVQYRGVTYFENISVSTASISENGIETISIYPNPASDIITLKTDEQIEKVQIFNIMGDLVQTEQSNSFSINELSTGIYIVDVKTTSGIYRTRISKK